MTCSLLGIVAASLLAGTSLTDIPTEEKKPTKIAYTFTISGFG